MKTKYLFYSLALAGSLAACTQEELVESPVLKDNATNRPVAGVVEFTTGDVESRFVETSGTFESGDVFGLYLMDEFVDGNALMDYASGNLENYQHKAEHYNANGTYWKYQNHWFGMYNFTSSIQSNYPFRAEKQGGKIVWKNDAKLVEGNYFAMYPQNKEALNRRDLWHSIEADKDLKYTGTKDGVKKFQNVDNQFFLGYKQIYRDATSEAEGVLKVDMALKGVMVPLAFEFESVQERPLILDKISFRNASGDALPTLAYIDPSSYNGQARSIYGKNTYEDWVIADVAKDEAINCGQDKVALDLYNEGLTWTKQTIMRLVDWTVPGDKNIPYGLKNTNKAYEYSFSFPAETQMNTNDRITVGVVVPAMDEDRWEDLQVDIYAWEKQNGKWVYSVYRPGSNSFSLKVKDETTIWNQAEETSYWNRIVVAFDDFTWKTAAESVMTSNTRDMEEAVLGHLAKNITGPVALTIAPDANGVVVTSDFLKALKADAKNGRPITLTFSGARGGHVTFNENNTMLSSLETMNEATDYVKFVYDSIAVYNNAEQTIDGLVGDRYTKIFNGANAKLNVVYNDAIKSSGNILAAVENDGEMSVTAGYVASIENNYKLTLSGGTVDAVDNVNDGDVTVNGNATVGAFVNKGEYNCGTCTAPSVNVTGTLNVTTFENGAENGHHAAELVIAEGAKIVVADKITNYSDYHNDKENVVFVNNGTIVEKANTDAVVYNYGVIDNNWVIDALVWNKKGATINNNPSNKEKGLVDRVINDGTINAYKGHVDKLKNRESKDYEGVVNVLAEPVHISLADECEGKIIFHGVVADHISGTGNGVEKIFRTMEEMVATELFAKMADTGSTILYLGHNLTLNFVDGQSKVAQAITEIVVESRYVNVTGHKRNATYTFDQAELKVLSTKDYPYEFHIEKNQTNLVVKDVAADNEGQIHVAAGCSFKTTADSTTYPAGTILQGNKQNISASNP